MGYLLYGRHDTFLFLHLFTLMKNNVSKYLSQQQQEDFHHVKWFFFFFLVCCLIRQQIFCARVQRPIYSQLFIYTMTLQFVMNGYVLKWFFLKHFLTKTLCFFNFHYFQNGLKMNFDKNVVYLLYVIDLYAILSHITNLYHLQMLIQLNFIK